MIQFFLQNEKASNNDSFEKSIADIKNFSRKFKIVTDYGIIQIANAVDNHIRGGVLCHIARKRFSQAMDVVTPVYIRKPQAEVQYEENQRKNEESHG